MEGGGAHLRLKALPLGYAPGSRKSTLDLKGQRLGLAAALQDEIDALIVNKTRPGVQLSIATKDAKGGDKVLDGLAFSSCGLVA